MERKKLDYIQIGNRLFISVFKIKKAYTDNRPSIEYKYILGEIQLFSSYLEKGKMHSYCCLQKDCPDPDYEYWIFIFEGVNYDPVFCQRKGEEIGGQFVFKSHKDHQRLGLLDLSLFSKEEIMDFIAWATLSILVCANDLSQERKIQFTHDLDMGCSGSVEFWKGIDIYYPAFIQICHMLYDNYRERGGLCICVMKFSSLWRENAVRN